MSRELELTQEEQDVIIDALNNRIDYLFALAERYKAVSDKDSQMDCVNEQRRVKKVLERFKGNK